MPEFYTWAILLINQQDKIGEKQVSVLGSRGGQNSPLMHVPLSFCLQNIICQKIVFNSCLLLFRDIIGGMATVYFNIPSRLSTRLSTNNHTNFVLQATHFLNNANYFKEESQEV